jgi:hypothetical protein
MMGDHEAMGDAGKQIDSDARAEPSSDLSPRLSGPAVLCAAIGAVLAFVSGVVAADAGGSVSALPRSLASSVPLMLAGGALLGAALALLGRGGSDWLSRGSVSFVGSILALSGAEAVRPHANSLIGDSLVVVGLWLTIYSGTVAGSLGCFAVVARRALR